MQVGIKMYNKKLPGKIVGNVLGKSKRKDYEITLKKDFIVECGTCGAKYPIGESNKHKCPPEKIKEDREIWAKIKKQHGWY